MKLYGINIIFDYASNLLTRSFNDLTSSGHNPQSLSHNDLCRRIIFPQ
nr:MAG TPA: hypothetical protein [Caudoviricetes sp.]